MPCEAMASTQVWGYWARIQVIQVEERERKGRKGREYLQYIETPAPIFELLATSAPVSECSEAIDYL
jgi:hypothetical protein